MHPVAKPAGSLLQQQVEAEAVGIGREDVLAVVAAEHDVIEAAGEMDARFSGHGTEYS